MVANNSQTLYCLQTVSNDPHRALNLARRSAVKAEMAHPGPVKQSLEIARRSIEFQRRSHELNLNTPPKH